MSDSRAPSPCAPDADADDADDNEVEAQPVQRLLFYQKKFYRVPDDAVVIDNGRPLVVESGATAGKLHECKSHQAWLDAGVHTRHIIKLKLTDPRGVLRNGFYVTFKIAGQDSDDVRIIRALHKTIAKRFFESWVLNWPEEKRLKYAELIKDEPSDDSQISPVACHWAVVRAPPNVLYIRPKNKPKEEPPLQRTIFKKKASTKKPTDDPPDAEDDDVQSSAAQSTALMVPAPQAQLAATAAAAGPSFFLQTPGACVFFFFFF